MKLFTLMTIACIYNGIAIFDTNAFNAPEVKALAMVESGNNPKAIGKRGERTEFQIKAAAWKQYMPKEASYFDANKKPELKIEFLARFTESVSRRFEHHVGRKPNRVELYAMYNMGFAGFKKRDFSIAKCPKSVRDRLMRYENLCYLYESLN